MRFSFIVTTCNIESYVTRCLESLRPCLRAGDEVIVIDDASTDATPEAVRAFGAMLPAGIGWQALYLGSNTPGGVGIPANLALERASGEGVFFVDGDDWLDAPGFIAARDRFEAGRDEILIANYLEFDERGGAFRGPADRSRWGAVPRVGPDPLARRLLALSMIAVPWRKFYRRDLLQRHRIRFPEGDFFYEDNPFHWQVCLNARGIGFHDRVLCYHRVNRPGQTMMAQGVELAAFFTHYRTIRSHLPADADRSAPALAGAAMRWIVANMSWHLPRLRPSAMWDYAAIAQPVLQGMDAGLWEAEVAPHYAGKQVGRAAAQLRALPLESVVLLWQAERQAAETEAMRAQLRAALNRLDRLVEGQGRAEARAATTAAQISALAALEELRALDGFAAPLPPDGGDDLTEP